MLFGIVKEDRSAFRLRSELNRNSDPSNIQRLSGSTATHLHMKLATHKEYFHESFHTSRRPNLSPKGRTKPGRSGLILTEIFCKMVKDRKISELTLSLRLSNPKVIHGSDPESSLRINGSVITS